MKPQALAAAAIAVIALGVATWRYHLIRTEQAQGRGILTQSLTVGEHVALEGTQIVDVIDLRPRQPGAPWRRLWISKTNHAILATSTFAPDGQPISGVRFEQVTFQPAAASDAAAFQAPADLVHRYGRAQPGDSPS